jgi:hypothetical protein
MALFAKPAQLGRSYPLIALAAIVAQHPVCSLMMEFSVVLASLGRNLQITGLHVWNAKLVK